MAMIRDGKVYRNIPEQVQENKENIEELLATSARVEIVDELPEVGEEGIIYLVANGESYSQYIFDLEDEEFKLVGGSLLNLENGTGVNSIQQKQSDKDVEFVNPNYIPSYTYEVGAFGKDSIMLNGNSMAKGEFSFAIGRNTLAEGARSFASGTKTAAIGTNSHAEGIQTLASGANGAHAEGNATVSSGYSSHAEGNNTESQGAASHAEGTSTRAYGNYSHAGGKSSEARGESSFAHGQGIYVNQLCQVGFGKFNRVDPNTLFVIGNGTSNSDRSNAFEVYKDGTVKVNGADLPFKKIAQITSTTLTEAQVEAFRNGCIIKDGITGISSVTTVAFPGFEYYGTLRGVMIYEAYIYSYSINLSNNVISRGTNDIKLYASAIGAAAVNPPSNNTGNIGGSSARWAAGYINNLYLSGEALVHTIKFDSSTGNGIVANDNSDINFIIGTSNYYRMTSQMIRPMNDNVRDLGQGTLRWRDLYLSRNLTDGTNSVTVSNIAQKGQTVIGTGTFVNGTCTFSNGPDFSDGLYFFTYGNCQAFGIITSTMLASSDTSPITIPMPVIYHNGGGSSRIGQLKIVQVDPDTIQLYLFDNQGVAVEDNFQITVIKTKLA